MPVPSRNSPQAPALRWLTTILKYALLVLPSVALIALLSLLAAGAWVSAILQGSARFEDAPAPIQKLAVTSSFRTRAEWVTRPDCAIFDHDLLYKPRPGTCDFREVEFATTQHFDDRGFRATVEPNRGSENIAHPRLLVVGDSHAMGWGVEDAETFASVLASEYGYETVNLGVASYGTVRELRRLQRDVEVRPTDVIVVQYCDNDWTENRRFVETGKVGPYQPDELTNYLRQYSRTPATTWPVAALIGRQLVGDMASLFAHSVPIRAAAAGPVDPATAMLAVVKRFPLTRDHRLLVVVVNPTLTSHLVESRELFTKAAIPLVIPPLKKVDFYDLDDHMRPSGHRGVGVAIAAALEQAGWATVPR
jgi:hypothetical protein